MAGEDELFVYQRGDLGMTTLPPMQTMEPQAARQALLEVIKEARKAIRDLHHAERPVPPKVLQIAEEVARQTGVPVRVMQGPARCRQYYRARAIAMLRIREETGETLDFIGRFFGGRDHTTALHAIRQAKLWRRPEAAE